MPHSGSETLSLPDTSQQETLTSDQSSMSVPTICEATRNVISSPALAAGPTLSGSQDGQTTDLSGPAPVLASRSRSRAGDAASPTSAISGLSGTNSSRSDDLQRSLASRLLPLLIGSDLCEVIWKPWTTPWGQCLSKPRARVRTTFGTDIGSWPTPQASDDRDRGRWENPCIQRRLAMGKQVNLSMLAQGPEIGRMVWPTPRAEKIGGYSSPGYRPTLNQIAATWVSPTAQDGRRGSLPPRPHDTGVPLSQQVITATHSNGSSAPTENRGALNPEFVCWLMGYPQEWVNCAPSEMPSTRGRRQRSSKQPAR